MGCENMKLSLKSSAIAPSLTLAIDAKAKQMSSEGIDVVGFGAGEPDFGTPKFILDAAKEALDRGLTKYTPVSGTLQLKQAICHKFKQDNQLSYEPNQIIVSNGAKHSLYNIFQAILNPGDEVLIPSPYWLSYPEMVRMADGIPVFIGSKEHNEFKLSPEDLVQSITKRTKALIINSPNNPTGSVYTESELHKIAEIAVANNLFVISDEIYEELLYDDVIHRSIASFGKDIYDLTITVNGMSKSYAMTGWRIGYVAAKREIIDIMTNIQGHSTSNPNSIAQYAACAALNGTKEEVCKMREEFKHRRDYMVERIHKMPLVSCVVPKGAFYVMMNISRIFGSTIDGVKITDSLGFSEMLLDKANVAVVPGIVFGAEGYARLSYATSLKSITKGLDRISSFIEQLVP
jgi:aspartate aminotransferase